LAATALAKRDSTSGKSIAGLLHAFLLGGVSPSLTPMTDGPKPTERERREQRLQAALRENLKRRKAQARGRAEGAKEAAEPHDSAGFAGEKENG
jgi:hypothetical protein